ncbi:MAG: Uma2 family endonuclease [Anaerolineae bacterium]|nr:Uma2 family endonuclease [Anaerolineae bacterium]
MSEIVFPPDKAEIVPLPVTESSITQETLWAYGEDLRVEVKDAVVIVSERDMTLFHLIIIQNLFKHIRAYVINRQSGWAFADGLRYILAGGRKKVITARQPDFSFLRAGRIPADYDPKAGRIPADYDPNGDFEGAPNLAVEVASPGQSNAYFTQLVGEYLAAGSEEVWVIYPARRQVVQYRRSEDAPRFYQPGDLLDVSALFPGLELPVDALFVMEP